MYTKLTDAQHNRLVDKLDDADRAIFKWMVGRYQYYIYSDALNTITEDYRMAKQYEEIMDDFLRAQSWKYI